MNTNMSEARTRTRKLANIALMNGVFLDDLGVLVQGKRYAHVGVAARAAYVW